MSFLLLIGLGSLAAATPYAIRRVRTAMRVSLAFSAAASAIVALLGASGFTSRWSVTHVSGIWQIDQFSGLLLLLLAILSFTATATSVGYVGRELTHGSLTETQARLYFACLPLFTLSMACALAADNLGLLWGSLEGTTLATTLLVALYRKDASIEAAWKYVILCSIGISLGLLGMLMFVAAAVSGAGIEPAEALSFSVLRDTARTMDPTLVRWAFVLIMVGLGTKVGFVPMHAWLPDAHSKTPSPISALLSGMLLNVALYAVLRFKTVADAVVRTDGAAWTDGLFLAFGPLSVLVASLFLLQQRNYKRMLAYSSVEHMGLIAFMIGLGPLGIAPALIHLVGHAILKSALFFASGEILLAYGTTKIDGVREMSRRLPATSALFGSGILLLIATPVSPLFVSEITMIGVGMRTEPLLTALILLALTLAAVGMMRSLTAMLYAKGEDGVPASGQERRHVGHALIAAHLALALALGALAIGSASFHDAIRSIAAPLAILPV